MGNGPVGTDTDPDRIGRRQLEAGGPLGFIIAVHDSLRTLGRPYYYSGTVPPWLGSRKTDYEQEDISFEKAYNRFQESNERERDFRKVPHCIIHQWRKYPARVRFAGTSDSPGGARRQKTPDQQIQHSRPLPSGVDYQDKDEQKANIKFRPAIAKGHAAPPLWPSKEDVPDIIRDLVDEDTKMIVTPWRYDVFVDFVMVAGSFTLLQNMEHDLMKILRTFHHRWSTGASNISGFFYESKPGAPNTLHGEIPEHMPTHTITWRLQQTENDAFPLKQLEEINMRLHGKRRTRIR